MRVLLERMLPWVGSFSGQVAVVTGASSEVGRSTAIALARCGAGVALISRGGARLKALQRTIRSDGGRVLAIAADVSDAASARAAMSQVRRSWGKVDLLINNAGRHGSSAHALASGDVTDLMRLNLLTATAMTQAALPFMCRQRGGTIVNVSPPIERSADGSWQGCLAAKFALIGFTEALRSEIGDGGPTLGLVMPRGIAEGPVTAIPPEWVSAATVLAAKFRLEEVTAPPGVATVEALRCAAPRVADAVSGWVSAAQRLIRGVGSEEADVSRHLPGELLRFAAH